MKNTIKAFINYSERTNTRYYQIFEIVDYLPQEDEFTKIREVKLDPDFQNNEVYEYDYYEVEKFDQEQYKEDVEYLAEDEVNKDDYYDYEYLAIKK